jgi:hypothetical protein
MNRLCAIALAAALAAASACAPESGADTPANEARAAPAAEAVPATAPPTTTTAPGASAPEVATPPSASAERSAAAASAQAAPAGSETARRCGWVHNPTPANWWLFDGHGEWILSTQGGEQASGMDDMPDLSTSGWVETNGHYGYGCACMDITSAPGTLQVVAIANVVPKPLKQCRRDKALPRP